MEKVIDILGVPYTVEEVDCVDKGTLCKGRINFMTGRILIDKTLPKEHKDVVLLHKILHAVFDLLGYDDLATDESKVQGIATALHQVITSQKIFLRWFSTKQLIREDNIGNIKTYIHENLHSRSASYFSPDSYARHKASEEAAVEYMTQQICERFKIPYTTAYNDCVNALKDVRLILEPQTTDYGFSKAMFDMDIDLRYTYIANRINAYKVENQNMRKAVRDRLKEDLRILAGVRKGGRSYDGR